MDQEPLVEEWKEAGQRFLVEFEKKFPLKAAFWLKGSEDDRWYLHVASDQINDSNFKAAYTEVRRAAKRMQGAYLDPFRVKIVNADDPVVLAVLEIRNRHPGPMGINYNGSRLGGASIEGTYIYPMSVTAP